MPQPSNEEVHKDMMEWWDMLQARPQKDFQRPEIQVETKEYNVKEGEELKIPVAPPDKILQ